MIAVDVMGGDYAPHQILRGALNAAKAYQPVMLFGPSSLIKIELDQLDRAWSNFPIQFFETSEIVEMAENPVHAVKNKRNSSLVKAVMSVKEGVCTGVISAGNSGALMAAATLFLGRLPDVERPAIAGLLPALEGSVVALDLGANVSCRPHHLFQFAHMGSEYAAHTLAVKNPRVGLLSNGHEDEKGSDLTKQTFALLKESSLNFIGNIEPHDVFMNKTDVVVFDGFTGNIFLKTIEAFDHLFVINKKVSFVKTGGAVLLGVDGRVVVCHGNSDALEIERAIMYAAQNPF